MPEDLTVIGVSTRVKDGCNMMATPHHSQQNLILPIKKKDRANKRESSRLLLVEEEATRYNCNTLEIVTTLITNYGVK